MYTPKYPETKRTPVTEELYGHQITDPYRWLEDSDAPEVLAWSKAQNEVTAKVLGEHAPVAALKDELDQLTRYDSFDLPDIVEGWYYWSERRGEQNQAVIYRRHGLEGEPEALLDPNELSQEGTTSVMSWSASPHNRYFWYTLSEQGSESGRVYIREFSTGKVSEIDQLPDVRYPYLIWRDDETGFYYERYPKPGSVPKGEEHYHARIAYHQMGDDPTGDLILFGEGRPKEETYDLRSSQDRTTLIIGATSGFKSNDLYLLAFGETKVRPFLVGRDAVYSLHIGRDYTYLYTSEGAEFYRLLSCKPGPLSPNLDDWQEIVPEVSGQPLEGFRLTADFLILNYLRDASSYIELRRHDGTFVRVLPLPPYSVLSELGTHWNEREFFYGVSSYTEAFTSFRYDVDHDIFVPYRSIDVGVDLSDIEVTMEKATSRDGTMIPVFIVRKRGLERDGVNPTILYGYGGFNSNSGPGFLGNYIPWLRRGGIFADAIIRGGAEYGQAWHEAGITPHKQNTFDDFIAAAEYLTKRKYTAPKHLGIIGASNGGLLVGAVAVQRPELFGAVNSRVPLLDMVRFPKFLIANRWTEEYGDPSDPEDLERILKWSPYHNVQAGTEYPPFLIMTGDHDTRVEPLHARKFAALLQATNKKNPVLLRTEIGAGHGVGTPRVKAIASAADMLGFFAWQLGLKII